MILYKAEYRRPAKQQNGTYTVETTTYWTDCTAVDWYRHVLESTNRDVMIQGQNFPYDTCGQTPPGNPPAGKLWGVEFILYPVKQGRAQTPITLRCPFIGDNETCPAFSVATGMDFYYQYLVATYGEQNLTHFAY